MKLDGYVRRLINENINLSVPWYLMASHAYYVDDSPILEDNTFDGIAILMKERWADIEHPHKHLITPDDLEATTYLGVYPLQVQQALLQLRRRGA